MTEKEEEFVHFTSRIASLNNAWVILSKLKEQKDNPLTGPAFRFALIEYSKPYKQAYGNKRWKSDDSHIPPGMEVLHKRIIDSRYQVHAHTYLTILEAKLYIRDTKDRSVSTIV